VNLFSVLILAEKGCHCDLGSLDCKFTLDGRLLAHGTKIRKSWWLDADMRSHELCMAIRDTGASGKLETIQTWYQRLGHLNKRDIGRLQNMATGINIGTPVQPAGVQCIGCLVGKDHRQISWIPRQ